MVSICGWCVAVSRCRMREALATHCAMQRCSAAACRTSAALRGTCKPNYVTLSAVSAPFSAAILLGAYMGLCRLIQYTP